MSLSTPTLYLNTGTLQTGDTAPFIKSLSNVSAAAPWSRVSGATGPLTVVLCTVDGMTATRATLDAGNTLNFTAKKEPADEDLAIEINFVVEGGEGAEVYTADEASLAVDTDIWGGKSALNLSGNFEERTAGGDVLRVWAATLALTRGNGDGGSPAPQIYVKTTVQALTAPQQAQARANIGAGTSSFNPASPGPIGGTTPGAINSTDFTLGAGGTDPLIIGDVATSTVTYAGTHKFGALGMVTFGDGADGPGAGSVLNSNGNFAAFSGGGSPVVEVGPNGYFGSIITASTVAGLVLKNSAGDTVATFGATTPVSGVHFISGGIVGYDGGVVKFVIEADTGNYTGEDATYANLSVAASTINIGGQAFARSGAHGLTLTTTGTTNVTLPLTGTLATLAGAETLTGKTLSDPVFSFGNDALVASVIATKQDREQALHYNASFWNTATISGVATHGLSACVAFVAVGASTNGFGRCAYATTTFSNPFSASINTIDFSQSWVASFRSMFRVGTNASARITLCFGVAQTHATHALTSRGFSVSVKGTGAAAELFLSAHNGTSQTSGTAVAFTANSSESDDYALYWKAGTGLYLYRNGTLLASVTTGLPSGSGTSGNTCVSQLAENVSGSGTPVDAYLIGCKVRRL